MNTTVRKVLLSALFLMITVIAWAATPRFKYVEIKTDKGTCYLRLYNETPLHRDNFLKLVKTHYFDDLLFHRVINRFIVQGGDPDSRNAKPGTALGEGGPDYTIPAEINSTLYHKKGAIGAAREGDDVNPKKASSGSQFYLVQGKKFSQAGLDSLEKFRMKGVKFTSEQRQAYTTIGGTPHLDGNYTVFGELVQGLGVVDAIAAVKTDAKDRPLEDVKMKMHVLSRREALNLERELNGLKPQKGLFTKIADLFSSKEY